MTLIDQLIQNELNLSEQKRRTAAEKSAQKQREIRERNTLRLDPTQMRVIDGDTVVDERTGMAIRVSDIDGYAINTFENRKYDADGNLKPDEDQPYADRRKFEQDARAYADYFGKKDGFWRKGVTPEQLYDYADVQKARLEAELQRRVDAGEPLEFIDQGLDDYGRTLGRFEGDFFKNLSNRENNASYESEYNVDRRLADTFKGEFTEQRILETERSGLRGALDQPVNFFAGLGGLVVELGDFVGNVYGSRFGENDKKNFRKEQEALVGGTKDAIASVRNALNSEGQIQARAMAQRSSMLQSELFRLRRDTYMESGEGEITANLLAASEQAANTVTNLLQDPGRVIDASFESMPYMFAVGGVARLASTAKMASLQRGVLTRLLKEGADPETAIATASRFLGSKAGQRAVNNAAESAGMATVGLMEGASSATAVYGRIMAMTPEEASQSKTYRDLIAKNMSHEDALREMAKKAFNLTFLTVAAGAAFAGKATGAVGFEARLFNKFAQGRQSIGASTIRIGQNASKETGEEFLQAGGGQLAQDVAYTASTGLGREEIGQNTAEAAITGAASGAFSGGGVSAVREGIRAAASGIANIQGETAGDSVEAPVFTARSENNSQTTQQNIERLSQEDITPDIVLNEIMDQGEDANVFDQVENLLGVMTFAQANRQPVSDETFERINKLASKVGISIKAKLDAIDKNNTDLMDPEVLQVLEYAGKLGMDLPPNLLKRVNEAIDEEAAAGQVYNMSKTVNDAIDELALSVQEGGAEIARVRWEVLGNGTNSTNGKPGMARHAELMVEALTRGDMAAAQKQLNEVINFFTGQQNKLSVLNTMVELGEAGKVDEANRAGKARGLTYSNGTKRFAEDVADEVRLMEPFVQQIEAAWNASQSSPDTTSAETVQQDESGQESARDGDAADTTVAGSQVAQDSPESTEGQEPSTPSPVEDSDSEEATSAAKRNEEGSVAGDTADNNNNNTTPATPVDADSPREFSLDQEEASEELSRPASEDTRTPEEIEESLKPRNIPAKIRNSQGKWVPGDPRLKRDFFRQGLLSMLGEVLSNGVITYVRDENGEIVERTASQNPDWFKSKGWTRKEVIRAVEVALDPKGKLYARQQDIIETMLNVLTEERTFRGPGQPFNSVAELLAYHRKQRETVAVADNSTFVDEDIPITEATVVVPESAESPTQAVTAPVEPVSSVSDPEGPVESVDESYGAWMDEDEFNGEPPPPENWEDIPPPTDEDLEGIPDIDPDTGEQVFFEDEEAMLPGFLEALAESPANETGLVKARVLYQELLRFRREATNSTSSAPINRILNQELNQFGTEREVIADRLLEALEEHYGEQVMTEPSSEVDQKKADQLLNKADKIINGEAVTSNSQKIVEDGVDLTRTRQASLRNFAFTVRDFAKDLWEKGTTREEKQANRQRALSEAFRAARLPERIRAVLEQGSEKTRSLIAAIPDFALVFSDPAVRRSLANKLNLSEPQEAALNNLSSFMNLFNKQMRSTRLQWMGEGGKIRREDKVADQNFLWTANGRNAARSLRQYGLQYFYDRLGNLNSNVESAMAVAGYKWLASRGVGGIQNNERRINFLLGRDENTQVTDDEILKFGRGTPHSVVAMAIGREVLKTLNLKQRDTGLDIDSMFYDRLTASIGNMVLGNLEAMNMIEMVRISESEIKKAQARDASESINIEDAIAQETGSQNWVFAKSRGDEGRYDLSDQAQQVVDDFAVASEIFEGLFGEVSGSRPPLLLDELPGMKYVPRKYARTESNVPGELRRRIRNMGDRPMYVSRSLFKALTRMGEDRFVEKIMGAPSKAKIRKAHVSQRESMQAKRDQALRSYRQAVEWDKKAGDKEFYFTFQVTSTGRTNMDSNLINPQNNAAHRWLYRMKEWQVDVPPKGKTTRNFMLAVALGMDIDISAENRNAALRKMNALYQRLAKDGVLDIMNTVRREEDVDPADMAKLEQAIAEGKEAMHSFAALEALAGWHEAQLEGKSYTTDFPVEIDGKTNGFAAGALQTPGTTEELREITERLLPGTGVFLEGMVDKAGKIIRTFAGYKGNNGKDNYQNVAQLTGEYIARLMSGEKIWRESDIPKEKSPEWKHQRWYEFQKMGTPQGIAALEALGILPTIQEFTTSVGRNFAKNPLTVIAYMGGMDGVKWSMANAARNKFWEMLTDENTGAQTPGELAARQNLLADAVNLGLPDGVKPMAKVTEAQIKKLMQKAEGKNDQQKFENVRANMPYSFDAKLNREYEIALGKMIYNNHGYALDLALEERVQSFENTRKHLNAAVNQMSDIYAAEFRQRVADQGGETGEEVSQRERREIFNQMVKEGLVPLVRSPLSTNHLDSIQITKDGRIYFDDPSDSFLFSGRAHFNTAEERFSETYGEDAAPTASLKSTLWGFDPRSSVGVAALVNLIHSTDGAVNSHMFGLFAVLHVHDAVVGNVNDIDEIGKAGNEEFLRVHNEYDMGREILRAYDMMLENIRISGTKQGQDTAKYMKSRQTKDDDLNPAYNRIVQVVQANSIEKKKLFSRITWVNQFAKDGTEAPGAATSTPSTPEAVSAVSTLRNMARSASAINGDPGAALLSYVRSDKPDPQQVLSILRDFLNNRVGLTQQEGLKTVLDAIESNLPDGLKIELSTSMNPDAAAQYDAEANVIFIHPKSKKNLFGQILHEMNHAAMVSRIEALEESNPERMAELVAAVDDFINKNRKRDNLAGKIARAIALDAAKAAKQGKGDVRKVAEFVAYATSTFIPSAAETLTVPLEEFTVAVENMATLVNEDINLGG
jgi:hypothetical protein